MNHTILNQDTIEAVRELMPLVEALNKVRESMEIATDHMLMKPVDTHDERIRDIAIEIEEKYLGVLQERAAEHDLSILFNRLNGSLVLIDRKT